MLRSWHSATIFRPSSLWDRVKSCVNVSVCIAESSCDYFNLFSYSPVATKLSGATKPVDLVQLRPRYHQLRQRDRVCDYSTSIVSVAIGLVTQMATSCLPLPNSLITYLWSSERRPITFYNDNAHLPPAIADRTVFKSVVYWLGIWYPNAIYNYNLVLPFGVEGVQVT